MPLTDGQRDVIITSAFIIVEAVVFLTVPQKRQKVVMACVAAAAIAGIVCWVAIGTYPSFVRILVTVLPVLAAITWVWAAKILRSRSEARVAKIEAELSATSKELRESIDAFRREVASTQAHHTALFQVISSRLSEFDKRLEPMGDELKFLREDFTARFGHILRMSGGKT